MKIGIICPTYPPSERPDGIGDFTKILADALAKRDNDVTVWTRRSHPGEGDGGRVRVVGFCDRWGPRDLGRTVALARREDLDVLDIQYAPALYDGPFFASLPLWMRLAANSTVSTVSFHTLGGRSLASRAKGWLLLRGARGVISTNEEVTYLVGKYLPRALSKTREIPIGSNIRPPSDPRDALRARVRSRWKIPADAPLLTHFGQFYPGKGVETLLEAAASLLRSGRAFRLLMIGGQAPWTPDYWKGLQERADRMGLADRVVWTGVLPEGEVAELLAASDLFVVPYEGGVSARRGSLMAGLACGAAIVSTTPRVPSSHFRDGENVALVPPRDPARLAAALCGLLDDEDRRRRLERGARELAGRFTWDRIADQTDAFFRELLAARKRER